MPAVPEQHLDRLLEISRSLVQELDVETVLTRVLDAARELTASKYAAIGILDPSRERFGRFISIGIDEELQQQIGPPPVGRGLFGTVIRAQTPVRVVRVGDHPDSQGYPPGHPPMDSFLGVPVRIGSEAWGVICCSEQATGRYDDDHERSLVLLAEWAAIAVHNADVLGRARKDRDKVAHALLAHRAARDVAQAIGSDVDLDHVLELISARVLPLIGANSVLVLLDDGHRYTVVAETGGIHRSIGDAEGPPPAASRPRGRPIARDELTPEELDYWTKLGAEGAVTAVIAPMIHQGTQRGLIAAFRDDRRPFSEADQELLQTYATSAATRVTIARSVQRERLQDAVAAAEAERRRWARELHDQTLQGLAALRLLVGAAQDDAPEASGLGQAQQLIEDEIAGLRAIIAELRPAGLGSGEDWIESLEALVEKQRRVGGPQISLDYDPATSSASPELLAPAFRIVQEAMTNALRHADARNISVSVQGAAEQLTITVSDDGHGFDVDEPRSGLGLVGMRERVELAGGELAIESGPGGTTVAATLGAAG